MRERRRVVAALVMVAGVAGFPAAVMAAEAPSGVRPRADVPLPPPPPGTVLNPGAAPAAQPAEPPVQLVGQLGLDFGFEKLLEVQMSDGSTRSITANQGVNGSVGAAFLKLAGGRLATQATLGVEYSGISASNGSARWLAFPFEVMEVAYVDPVRFGAGVSYLLAPSVSGSGVLDGFDAKFKSSLGLLFQADWVWRMPRNLRASRFTVGLRFVVQKLELKAGGPAFGANAMGIVAGFTG